MASRKTLVCVQCGRHFKTKSALTQHMRAAHVANHVARAAPRSRKLHQPRSTGLKPHPAQGSDLLTVLEIEPRFAKYSVLKTIKVGPRGFGSARLDLESKLWARWRPQKLQLRVVCAGSTATYGSIVVGWIPDPSHTWLDKAESSLSRIISSPNHMVMRLSSSGTLNIPVTTSRKWYHTSGTDEDSYHGQIAIVTATPTGGFSGSTVGITIELDWKVEFEGEDLPDSAAGDDTIIYPDAGWTNLFTTSDGSFNSKVLTFKEHSGGDMAPFSGARFGVVYAPANRAKIFYLDSSSRTQTANYFVRVSGFDTPGLLLFATFQDARDYITSGDVDKALKYYGASKVCEPPSPGFKPTSSVLATDPAADRIADLENVVYHLMERLRGVELVPNAISATVTDKVNTSAVYANTDKLAKTGAKIQKAIDKQSLGTLTDPVVATILPIPISGFDGMEEESISSSIEVLDEEDSNASSLRVLF